MDGIINDLVANSNKDLNFLKNNKTLVNKSNKTYKTLTQKELSILNYYKFYGDQVNEFILNDTKDLTIIISNYDDDNNDNNDNNDNDIGITNKCNNLYNIFENNYNSYMKYIKLLDTILNKQKTTSEVITYRGDSNFQLLNKLKKLKINDTFTFENYLSVSLKKSIAQIFTKGNQEVLSIIIIPKNFNYLYLPWNPNSYGDGDKPILEEHVHQSEYELVLPRNCELKLIDKHTIKKQQTWKKKMNQQILIFKLNENHQNNDLLSFKNIVKSNKIDLSSLNNAKKLKQLYIIK
jgi:hypothetical protein